MGETVKGVWEGSYGCGVWERGLRVWVRGVKGVREWGRGVKGVRQWGRGVKGVRE